MHFHHQKCAAANLTICEAQMFNGEETLEGASLTEMIQEVLKQAETQTTVLLFPMQGPASDSEELCFVLDIPEAHGPALNMRIDDEDTSDVDGKVRALCINFGSRNHC